MTTMIAEVYRAFVKAGVPEQDAMAAAEALACMDARLQDVGGRAASGTSRRGGRAASGTKAGTAENLATKKDIDAARLDIHRLDKNMAVVQWMLGIVIAAQVLPLLQVVAAIL